MRILFPSKLMLTAVISPTRNFRPIVIRPLASAGRSLSTVESVRYRVKISSHAHLRELLGENHRQHFSSRVGCGSGSRAKLHWRGGTSGAI